MFPVAEGKNSRRTGGKNGGGLLLKGGLKIGTAGGKNGGGLSVKEGPTFTVSESKNGGGLLLDDGLIIL